MIEVTVIDIVFRKLLGWILVLVGLIVIFWSAYSSFEIFTNRKPAPEVFKAEEKVDCPPCEKISRGSTQEEIQQQIEKIVEGQLKERIKEFIPMEFIIKTFNLISWGIFVAILIFAGGQVAGLGIKLMKVK